MSQTQAIAERFAIAKTYLSFPNKEIMMRIMMYLDGDVPVLKLGPIEIRLSNREFDRLFYDMKMVARHG